MSAEETYQAEYVAYMRLKEANLPEFRNFYPQIGRRRFLVDWICLKGEKLSLPKSTLHLSIVLLDRFLDAHFISKAEYLNWTCLGKFSMFEFCRHIFY